MEKTVTGSVLDFLEHLPDTLANTPDIEVREFDTPEQFEEPTAPEGDHPDPGETSPMHEYCAGLGFQGETQGAMVASESSK